MSKHSIVCAGIDTGKSKLDVAIAGSVKRWCFDNTPQGHAMLSAGLRQHQVKRVGIEASGGCERAVVAELRRDGFVVIVFQPIQVRAYAKFHLQRAKNDKIDAGLVAACKALDRVIRSGRYWVPHWYKPSHWLAYWDVFGRPPNQPRYARAIPDTWWYDRERAEKLGL